MELSTRKIDDVMIIDFQGSLDTSTSGDVQDEFIKFVEDGETKIILNLKNLEYVSSAGLRVILILSKLLQSHQGELRLCSANKIVDEVLKTSGFNSLLQVLDTEANAIASVVS